MKLFFTLILKDCLRIRRNPVPLIIFIAIPLLITALIGLTFGGMDTQTGKGISAINAAVVDEDDSIFCEMLKGASSQDEFKSRINLHFLDREEALKRIKRGKLSAVLVIPEGFSEDYLSGSEALTLELIKNPAESIYPTLAQEGMAILVTFLNAVSRNFGEDLRELRVLIQQDGESSWIANLGTISAFLDRNINRLEGLEDYLTPPLISYTKVEKEAEPDSKSKDEFNLFGFLLIGLASMFLLMTADNCMRDLYRESRLRTLERYRTMKDGLIVFILSKVTYAVTIVLIILVVLMVGGSLIFGIEWKHPVEIAWLAVSYGLFAAGLMGLMAAVVGSERRADVVNNMLAMTLAMTGGAMWPPEQLPAFFKEHLLPVSPVYWFTSSIRKLQSDWIPGLEPLHASLLLAGGGIVFILGATILFRMRLEKGVKA